MRELMRSNDMVAISAVETLLREAGMHPMVADQNMSVMEGSIGILPRRILVPDSVFDEARQLLRDADLGHFLRDPE